MSCGSSISRPWFFGIPTGCGFPLQEAGDAVETPDRVHVGNEVVSSVERPCELDLQVLQGLANTNAVVLCKALEKLDPLLQHAIPGFAIGVLERTVPVKSPFCEQHGCRVLPTKVSR